MLFRGVAPEAVDNTFWGDQYTDHPHDVLLKNSCLQEVQV